MFTHALAKHFNTEGSGRRSTYRKKLARNSDRHLRSSKACRDCSYALVDTWVIGGPQMLRLVPSFTHFGAVLRYIFPAQIRSAEADPAQEKPASVGMRMIG